MLVVCGPRIRLWSHLRLHSARSLLLIGFTLHSVSLHVKMQAYHSLARKLLARSTAAKVVPKLEDSRKPIQKSKLFSDARSPKNLIDVRTYGHVYRPPVG